MAIKTCTCEHEYQDKRYGKHKRVANACVVTPPSPPEFRCTVCTKIISNSATPRRSPNVKNNI